MPNPPNWAKLKLGVSLTLDKSWGQRHARIIPARFVKPYVKSNKTDTVDAAAIAEAVTRPTMRFVEVRTPDQVDLQALHRIRDCLVGQRTGLMNQRVHSALNMALQCGLGPAAFMSTFASTSLTLKMI